MQRPPSFFEGVAADALDGALAGLELRRFPAGSVIIAEGDYRGEMYVLRSGTADAVLVDRKGEEHVLNTIHPGEAIGEMSLLTESAASATVRARDDVELLVLEAADLDALLEALPQIQRNLVRTLSSRLARVSRLALHEQPGRLVVVEDDGDAEELPCALAASIAWHTRSRTLHVALGTMPPARDEPREGHGGARTIAADVGGAFAPERIDATLDELLRLHDHVVLQLPRAWATRPVGERRVRVNAEGFTLRAEGDQRTVPAPELDDDDRASLEQGLLPNDTEAGKAIGAVARELAGLRVGVALGAGSIRGYAHVGALRALERHGVPIDCLAGTSIGATVAAAYSIFGDVDEVKEFLDGLGARMFRPTVSRKSLLTTAAMRRYAGRMLGDPLLENTAIPIAVVATDVDTQDEVV